MIAEPVVLSIIGFGFSLAALGVKNLYSRVSAVEKEYITEEKTRRIMNDNISPIKDDLHEIRKSIDKLLNLYIEGQK